MAAAVLPLQPIKLPTAPTALTPEQKYWRSFASQLQLPSHHSSPITSILHPAAPSPTSTVSVPETFAVTSGQRIQILSTRTRKVVKSISRFNVDDVARSGDIRRDGRVVVAGGDSGVIQVFDASMDTRSRAIFKTWREHKQAVWVTRWHPTDPQTLMSTSDDTTVRLWDLPGENSVQTFVGHTDYVRCGQFLTGPGQLGGGLLVSGSYDQTVRLWDPRKGGRAVMVFKHAAPVESVCALPGGTNLLASADNTVSVLDILAGKPRHILRNHQKTVTALAAASHGTRVLTGGLDGHVKVFETSSWNVVEGFKYPSPILSLDVVPSGPQREDRHLVVGMQSGLLFIRTRWTGRQGTIQKEREKEMQALIEGRIEEYDKKIAGKKRSRGWEKRLRGKDFTGEGADIVVDGNARSEKHHFKKWEVALRKGQYERALDLALQTKNGQETLTLLTALRHRSALRTALSGRNEITLQPILKYLNRALGDPRHMRLLTDVCLMLLDVYAESLGQSEDIDNLVRRLHGKVRENTEISQTCWNVLGIIEMFGVDSN